MEKSYQRPQIEVKCGNCGEFFMKDGSEIRRNKKIGRDNYCSLSCGAKGKAKNPNGNPEFLVAGNRRDKYTGLREHLNRVKTRNKESGKEYNITLDYLLTIWNEQNQTCPYTGVKLQHPTKVNKEKYGVLYIASLDRIDSSKGYVIGNIQFVSQMANLAKNSVSHQEMVEFCKAITKKWNDS